MWDTGSNANPHDHGSKPTVESEASSQAKKVFHPGLEGLRGASVLAVLIFHARPDWLPGGFLGVSSFFTLSGFLITGLLVAEWDRTQNLSLLAFWGRRLRRLLPASLLALFGIALAFGMRGDPVELQRLFGDGLSALFYVSNWWLIGTGAAYDDLMGSPSTVQHFWSLSIEEQYYFAYPIIAYAIFRLTSGSTKVFAGILVVASLSSFVWMSWLSTSDVSTARLYYGTDTRAAELLAGGLLAIVLAKRSTQASQFTQLLIRNLGVVGVAITAVGWMLGDVNSNALYRGGLALYTVGTMAIVAAAIQPTGLVRALLSLAPLRWLGRISYGAYVYHWPLFMWFDDNVVRLLATLLVAELSYRLLEEPIRSGAMVVGSQRLVVAPVAIAVVAVAFVFATPRSSDNLEPPRESERKADTRAPGVAMLRIAVAGDSVANDVAEALTEWGKSNDIAEVLSIASHGCGIARGAWGERRGRREVECDKWPDDARRSFTKFEPDVVVVLTVGWDFHPRRLPAWDEDKNIGDPMFDEWMIREYAEAVDLFGEFDAHVAWLTTPCYISRAGHTTGTWDPAHKRKMNDHILPELARHRADQVSIVDLERAICPNGEYTNSLFGIESFRPDGIHFSRAGKKWLGNWLGEELLREMELKSARDKQDSGAAPGNGLDR